MKPVHGRTFHVDIPEDRLEPRSPVQFRCPQCGLSQDFAVCKCGEPLCEKCDPDPEMHVRCLPPERMTPYLLLQDCEVTLMLMKKAHREHKYTAMLTIADNQLRVLRGKSFR